MHKTQNPTVWLYPFRLKDNPNYIWFSTLNNYSKRGKMHCSLCHASHANLHIEIGNSANIFCNAQCQKIQYHLITAGGTKREREREDEDEESRFAMLPRVLLEMILHRFDKMSDLIRACKGNALLAKVCDTMEFKRRYCMSNPKAVQVHFSSDNILNHDLSEDDLIAWLTAAISQVEMDIKPIQEYALVYDIPRIIALLFDRALETAEGMINFCITQQKPRILDYTYSRFNLHPDQFQFDLAMVILNAPIFEVMIAHELPEEPIRFSARNMFVIISSGNGILFQVAIKRTDVIIDLLYRIFEYMEGTTWMIAEFLKHYQSPIPYDVWMKCLKIFARNRQRGYTKLDMVRGLVQIPTDAWFEILNLLCSHKTSPESIWYLIRNVEKQRFALYVAMHTRNTLFGEEMSVSEDMLRDLRDEPGVNLKPAMETARLYGEMRLLEILKGA